MKELSLKATTLAVMMACATPSAFAEDASTWLNDGAASLAAAKKTVPNVKRAKNVILFVGDGMGISTITAARIFEGQQKGVDGER
jgi:alkaline phosphatase